MYPQENPPLPEPEEQLPHDFEAEQSVIGAMLMESSAFDEVQELLRGDEFYSQAHIRINDTLREMVDEGTPIDLVTLTSQLRDKEQLDEVGGVSYLAKLIGSVPTTANVAYYCDIVKKKAMLRRAILETRKLANEAWNSENPAEVIARIQMTAQDLGEQQTKGKGFRKIGDMLRDHAEILEKRYMNRDKGLTGVKTPLNDLDKLTGGRQKGDLIIVAARPSVGKTAFEICEAFTAAESGTVDAVGFFSLEMSDTPVLDRFVAMAGNIDGMRIRSGRLEGEDWERYSMAVGYLSDLQLFIDSDPGMTIQQIRAKGRALKRKHGSVLLIIDYLQMIAAGRKFQNRDTEVGYITQQLKEMAKELDCPVIAISSLGRSVEQRADKRPMLSDLRESGQIEFHADEVDFLYRDDYYSAESEKKNIVEVIVAKGRNTGTGVVEGVYIRNTNRFVNLDRQHAEAMANVTPIRQKTGSAGRDWA